MAKRPKLSAVDLTDTSTQRSAPAEPARNSKAQTLRLPPDYWRRLLIAAAIQDTSQIAIVQRGAASVVLPRDDSWRAAEPARVATPVANKPVAHKTETPHDQTSGSSPTAQPDPYAETDRRQVEANYKAELENFRVLA
jgi:hypothetical protein